MSSQYRPKNLVTASITVDVVVFTVQDMTLKLLLTNRSNEPFKDSLALPGGFIRVGETAYNAVKRLMIQKTGVNDVFVEQLYTFDAIDRDPRDRTFSISYFAFVPEEKLKELPQVAQLVRIDAMPRLAFDHNVIVEYAIKRARAKLEYTNAAYSLLPKRFTLSELQSIYEVILGESFDKRNFRKKILSLDILDETNDIQRGRQHRPARLYNFKQTSIHGFRSPFVFKSS